MSHVWIRNRQHDSMSDSLAFENLGEENHFRLTVEPNFAIHTMVCGHSDHCTESVEAADDTVDVCVECDGFSLVREVFVLHEIGRREIVETRG